MEMKLEAAYQLLYRTTHNDGSQPSWTVTTVFVPHNASRDAFVMAADPTDANSPKCQPSYLYMGGGIDGSDGYGLTSETLYLPYMYLGYICLLYTSPSPRD